ncbi:CTD kinase subunit gamma Ctk3C-terminal [Penicillium sp. IBT 31633x]|nr:CTD kinase subunit gamma Ctk3C-terminal [Penicillium sp. IBT 31633x]
MSGQGSGGEGQSWTQPRPDQDALQPQEVNREAEGLHEPISFKRKQKQRSRFSLSSLLSPIAGGSNNGFSSSAPQGGQNGDASPLDSYGPMGFNGATEGSKDGGPLDWYVEGPGRRVGYDDFTAIDWIYEYTKERQRKRLLYSSGQGLLGHARRLLDASNIWLVLITTGIAVGITAASIDIATDWLGDLKSGYCKTGSGGGKFYLNRSFCCWGLDDYSKCLDWTPWGNALGTNSKAGTYTVEFIFYVAFSVTISRVFDIEPLLTRCSGIPEIKTILGGTVIRHFMGPWTLGIKSLGLCLSVASGLWLGKEGPLVHVACCCANILMKPFDGLNGNEARKREVLSAAAAAGISVAFGAPIGGVLFSLEQLSYYFPDKTMWQSFVCAMVAAVTLQALNPFRTGKIVLYQVTYTRGWHRFEIIPFIILGIIGGLYGAFLIRLNMRITKWRRANTSSRPIIEVVVVALVTALINYPNHLMRAQNSELVQSLFAECNSVTYDRFGLCATGSASFGVAIYLVVAALLVFFLASLTFGLEIPAGIILPSVAIGALYGRALGIMVRMWQEAYPNAFLFSRCEPDIPCVTPGLYAIIGAAAALGGATRMTLSIVVIMFELTGALTYVIPIMIAVMLSKWCGDIFGKRGIYESWIRVNEYPFLDHRDDTTPPDVSAQHVMTTIDDLSIITATGHTIASIRDLLANTTYRGFPVVSEVSTPILLGYITRNELSFALKSSTSPTTRNLSDETQVFFSHQPFADPIDTLDLRPWMDQTPITLNSNITFLVVLRMFQRLGLRYVLFANKGILQGLLTKKDVWSVLNGVEFRRDEALRDEEFRDFQNSHESEEFSNKVNPPDDKMMIDPFEVRMRFTTQLQHLSAAVTSSQKAAHYALKYRDLDEDLHSCILEQLERNNMNNRANIMYFIEHLCEMALKENYLPYVRMMQRDILRVVDSVVPPDGTGAANVKHVRHVLSGLQTKQVLSAETVAEIDAALKDRESHPSHLDLEQEGTTEGSKPKSEKPQLRLDKRQIEQRIEEDRERNKRQRESMWAMTGNDIDEYNQMWEDLSPIGEDDFVRSREEALERAECVRKHEEFYKRLYDVQG